MKNTLKLAIASLFILLTSAAWCQVIETKLTIRARGLGPAIVLQFAGGASEFHFQIIVAGRAHKNPTVTIGFARGAWQNAPVCQVSQGWTIDRVSVRRVRIRWTGKPGAGDVISARVTCSDD